jgi:hypothetical protein
MDSEFNPNRNQNHDCNARLALAVKDQDVDGSPRYASARSPPEMRQIFSDWRLAN